jgi:hypothetical protein
MIKHIVCLTTLALTAPAWADGPVDGAPELAVTTTKSPNFCGGQQVSVRQVGKPGTAEPELVAALTMTAPRDLDFSAKKKEKSLQRFNAFVSLSTKTYEAATTLYQRQLAKGGTAEVVAAARLVQLYRRYAEIFTYIEVPADVRTGDLAKDKIEAFCKALDETAAPLRAKAGEAAKACREAADKAKAGAGWWTPVCAAH